MEMKLVKKGSKKEKENLDQIDFASQIEICCDQKNQKKLVLNNREKSRPQIKLLNIEKDLPQLNTFLENQEMISEMKPFLNLVKNKREEGDLSAHFLEGIQIDLQHTIKGNIYSTIKNDIKNKIKSDFDSTSTNHIILDKIQHQLVPNIVSETRAVFKELEEDLPQKGVGEETLFQKNKLKENSSRKKTKGKIVPETNIKDDFEEKALSQILPRNIVIKKELLTQRGLTKRVPEQLVNQQVSELIENNGDTRTGDLFQMNSPGMTHTPVQESSKGGYTPRVMTQLQESLKYMKQNGQQQIDILLHPRHLGTLSIKMVQSSEKIELEVRVQNQEALSILRESREQLRMIVETLQKGDSELDLSFSSFENPQDNQSGGKKGQSAQKFVMIDQEPSDEVDVRHYVGMIEIVV